MAGTPHLNGAIRALEEGKAAFVTFCAPETGAAQAIAALEKSLKGCGRYFKSAGGGHRLGAEDPIR